MIVLRCPLCGQPCGEVSRTPGAVVRIRCMSRKCRDKPRVTWGVNPQGRAVRVKLDVDRHLAAAV